MVYINQTMEVNQEDYEWPELQGISKLYEEAPLQEEKEISMASEAEDKRWSLDAEISKLFNASLDRCFPKLEEEAEVFRSTKKEHGDYTWYINVFSSCMRFY